MMIFSFLLFACMPEFPEPKGDGYPEDEGHDYDGDGFTEAEGDCDDLNAERFPENPEKCDYIDNDCDEEVDNLAEDALIWYLDEDQDQYGNQNFFIQACENPGGFTKVTTDADGNELFDCDDQNRLVFPGAAEVCDTVDNDCNELIDEDDPNLFGNATWYRDADGDGYGNPELFIDSCEPQPGYVQGEEELPVEQQDCNDALAIVNPAQAELCDEIDNDCDGQIDGEDPNVMPDRMWWTDADGDGFGDPLGETLQSCDPVDGFAGTQTDCDDSNAEIHPGVIEVCDEVDNNCDALIDEELTVPWFADEDGDGFGAPSNVTASVQSCPDIQPEGYVDNDEDCDDNPLLDEDGVALGSLTNPNADEVCDEIDNNCNNLTDAIDPTITGEAFWYRDVDQDGFGNPAIVVVSCDALAGFVVGLEDLDVTEQDCNDLATNINPQHPEICDEIDNDCDGVVDGADDNVSPDIVWYADLDGDGFGDENSGTMNSCTQPEGFVATNTDCDDENEFVFPNAPEVCDGKDDDCDTLIDEGVKVSWYADDDGDGFGASPQVTQPVEACPDTPPANYVSNYDDCNDSAALNEDGAMIGAGIFPNADEYCDGVDNDCDTLVDENDAVDARTWFADTDGDTYGDASVVFLSCDQPVSYVDNDLDCDDIRDYVNPDAQEDCSTGTDDNCNNTTNDIDALFCENFFKDGDLDNFGAIGDSLCMCEADVNTKYTALLSADCDDEKPGVNPEEVENCDTEYDDDCDGDTNDISAANCSYFYYDNDLDTFGTEDKLCMCVVDGFYTADKEGDCDDTSSLINPSKDEICDDADTDENCDGLADDATAVPYGDNPGAVAWYRDADEDGYGDENVVLTQCDQPIGYLEQGADCDDSLSAVNPSKEETCFSNDDEDCSGTNNDDGAIGCATFYADVDGDSYGTNADSQCLCYAEDVYTSTLSTDCDDELDTVNPGKDEVCDEADIDENCNGQADEMNAKECDVYFYDADDDGFGVATNARCLCAADGEFRALFGGDCEDDDASYNPDFDNCGLMGDIETSDAAMEFDNFKASTGYLHSFGFDYNNDGYEDFVYVNTTYDTDYTDAGGVFLFLGPFESNIDFNNIADEADLVFTIEAPQTNIHALYTKNIDSDVFDEIVVVSNVGIYVIDDNLIGTGVLTNNSDGIRSSEKSTNTIYKNKYKLESYRVKPYKTIFGDFNNDGEEDIISSFPQINQNGQVSVKYGPFGEDIFPESLMIDYLYDQTLENTDGYFFGFDLEVIDLNNDGIDDVKISYQSTYSAHHYPDRQSHQIYLGSSDGLIPSVINDKNVYISKDRYDINGDGIEEYLLFGSATNPQPCFIFDPITEVFIEGDYIGSSTDICQWGDINGDGFVDVIQNAYSYERELGDLGTLLVWFGSEDGISSLLMEDADIIDTSRTQSSYRELEVLDIDDDGIAEVFTSGTWELTGDEFVYTNTLPIYVYHEALNPMLLSIDLDGDGSSESISHRPPNLYTILQTNASYNCDGEGVFSDFDNDGIKDLFCPDNNTSEVYTNILGINSGSTSTAVGINTGGINNDVYGNAEIIDLDGNDFEDVMIRRKFHQGQLDHKYINESEKFGSYSNTTIVLNVLQENQRILSGHLIDLKDLDGDGYDEIIMSEDFEVSIYNPIMDSTFTLNTDIEDARGFFANVKGTDIDELILFEREFYSSSLSGNLTNNFAFYEMGETYEIWHLFQEMTYRFMFRQEGEGFQLLDTNEDGYMEMYHYDGKLIFTSTEDGVTNQSINVGLYHGNYAMTHPMGQTADLDGDGTHEVIDYNATYNYNDPFQGSLFQVGQVSIKLSSGTTWEMVGTTSEQIGALTNVADVNGDGQDDLLIQKKAERNFYTYLFYGPLQTYVNENGNIRPARPDDADATFEGRVLHIFDNNEDGYDDLVMSYGTSATSTFLYHGAPNSAVEPPTSPSE